MQALGNDFMVIDGVNQKISLTPALIGQWADRHQGIGFDQLLLIEISSDKEFDFIYRIFNADGSEVAQCGNGARCIARFVQAKKLSSKNKLRFKTSNGTVETELLNNEQVSVNIGLPKFDLADIPAIFPETAFSYPVEIKGMLLDFNLVSMGNPHAVVFTQNVAEAPVLEIGAALQNNAHFPQKVNVGFAQILDKHKLKLRVFERGVGETQACGSGACAAVVAGRRQGLLNDQVKVELPGGRVEVEWKGEVEPVFLSGEAIFVYQGEIVYEHTRIIN